MAAADAIKSFVGARWDALYLWAHPTLRPLLLWLAFRAVMISVVCFVFHPVIRAIARPTLLTYLGMTFEDITISPLKLKLTIRKIELLPSKSSILRSIILAIFPSAHVHKVENHLDYPESRICVRKLSIKLRVSSLAGPALDGDPCTSNSSHPHEGMVDVDDTKAHAASRLKLLHHLIPRFVVKVKLDDVTIEIEKTYLAPEPPEQFRDLSLANRQKLPIALPRPNASDDLPTFHQASLLDSMENAAISEADKISLFVERWIDHARTKLKKKGSGKVGLVKSFSFGKDSESDPLDQEDGHTDSGDGHAEQQTFDEKVNAWIRSIAAMLLRRISFELQNGSVVISGAGSELVKKARKQHRSPRDANLALARVPRQRRALTVVGTESISLSFSPDSHCNARLCFVGLHAKVGNPVGAQHEAGEAIGPDSLPDIPYVWHTVAHPCHLVGELKGVLPFLVWATSYDYHWQERSLGLVLSKTEVAVNLSPHALHTALLHFDDYTDVMSPYNEWLVWLKKTYRQKHHTPLSKDEEELYRCNYARIKGARKVGGNIAEEGTQLTVPQIKEMERRMTMEEIMDLRCRAMRNDWRIPKASKDFEIFLRNSRSSIRDMGDESPPSAAAEMMSTSPFEQIYPTPLHALVALIRNNTSVLAPHVTVQSSIGTLHIDFYHEGSKSPKAVPSSITVTDVSLDIDQRNILTVDDRSCTDLKAPRPFLDISLTVCGVKWGVDDNTATSLAEELPLFRDRSPVGMVYMSEEAVPSKHALALELAINVMPTSEPEQHYGIAFQTASLVIVMNPLPLLSALQNLLELSDVPFQPIDEIEVESDEYAECPGESAGTTQLRAEVCISVENTQLIFLVDRRKVPRGILLLNVNGISIDCMSGDQRGTLSLMTEPIVLHAGQIAQNQSSDDGKIDTILMPFQPTMDVDGAKIKVLSQEHNKHDQETSSDATTMNVNIEIGTNSLFFNASPATIVALFGVVKSLDPFLQWSKGEKLAREEERRELEKRMTSEASRHVEFQRQVLIRIFTEIDSDGDGTLDEDELLQLVLRLFDEESSTISGGENQNGYLEPPSANGASQKTNPLTRPTPAELKRERDHLLRIVDPNRADEISFQEIMDHAFFNLANKISDTNRIPTIKDAQDLLYNDHFEGSDAFLSGPWLRKLVYYNDLREYASMTEVYRITGHGVQQGLHRFPAPSVWRQGGIDHFWEMYTQETGCDRASLNGQNIAAVQRKLVRSLCNYEFAKFCWKTLVQPALNATLGNSEERFAAHWILDKNSRALVKSGVIDRLLNYVETEVKKEEYTNSGKGDIHYDVCLSTAVDSAVLRFGSSHTFTNPLFEARFRQMSIKGCSLLSPQTDGWFVPEKPNHADGGDEQDNHANHIHFQCEIGAHYLNTKHNHMETLIESYPSFGSVSLKVHPQDSKDAEAEASLAIRLNCPRFLNINTSRSFFETSSVLSQVVAQSDPDTFRTIIFDRDATYLRNCWDAIDVARSGTLSREEVLLVLYSVIEKHWKDEIAGLGHDDKRHFIEAFCSLAEQQGGDGTIYLQDLLSACKMYTARCYFSGSKEILLNNNIGRTLKASTKDNIEDQLKHISIVSESDYQRLLGTFLSVDDGSSCAVPLCGKLSFATYGYKLIDDISVSPYQTVMFPLKRKKRGSQRRRRHTNASGFKPFLTVVPKSDSLDSIELTVRTNVTVQTDIPIKIRIVRLGKTAPKFHKQGKKRTKLDLTKRGLMAGLRSVVEGAPIVYEKSCPNAKSVAPLPLDVLDSSHFHVMLIEWNNSWRDPIILTKDFLFNPTNIRQVKRCHALSGIVVRRERLNVHLSGKDSRSPAGSDTKRSILRRTAWDTTIQVVPFFNLVNGLPFPIVVRSWQTSEDDGNDAWDEPVIGPIAYTAGMGDNSSSDEEMSFMTPSINGRRARPDDVHLSSGASLDHYSQENVAIGQMFRFSGVSLREPLFIQVSQSVNSPEDASFMWTNPLRLDLPKLNTGINPKGQARLPKLVLDLGDRCDCVVDVTVEGATGVPAATIYSPYWIMNKTGAKLEYRVAGQKKSYSDSGSGGLPILIHGSRTGRTNEKYKNASSEISVIPLERPNPTAMATSWWDEASNGVLVLPRGTVGEDAVDWSQPIELDAAGIQGEIICKRYMFSCSIDSLAGVFHRSNLISFTPRFIVKNTLHIAISIIPVYGGVHDAIRKASHLRQSLKKADLRTKVNLAPGESTIIYNFRDISSGLEKPYHWVVFCVNASRYGASFKARWHLIPAHNPDTYRYGEHDGVNDTVCGLVEAKVQHHSTGSMVVTVAHTEVPPFVIENRSNTHHIRLVQDDAEAVVFELPPMFSCAYTWDSPLGKKKLRAVAIPETKSKNYQLEEALKLEREEDLLRDSERDETLDTVDSDDDESTMTRESKFDPLLFSLTKGVKVNARELNKTARYRSPRKKAVFSLVSRSYELSTVGKQKDLPCPSAEERALGKKTMSSHLIVYTRIVAGTKILSFSDSSYLADQVRAGILRKGGNFKTALVSTNIEGVGIYICDDFPREVIGCVLRDIQLHKQMGSIETMARVRHFQIDAYLPNARYPIIVQPLALGVDRREPIDDGVTGDRIVPNSVDKKECFWRHNDEKPVPCLEIEASYVPQDNMTWIPRMNIFICPLQLRIDVPYILRVVGMVVNSVYKYQGDASKNHSATSSANDQLKYVARGEMNVFRTYIETLHISQCYFQMELNMKSDDLDDGEVGDSNLTLHSIAQSTNSAAVAAVGGWLINVGSNFAHVSPCFRYVEETYTDQYCDLFDLLSEIAMNYIIHTIKQSYKVVFSMQLLGDPSYLLLTYRTGVKDFFVKTRDEIAVGGKDGVGKGVSSLVQNVMGETFFAVGKVTGGVADTIDAVTTNETTSNHLKPKPASSNGRHPDNAIDGVVEGTKFLGKAVVHGVAGVVGNPYRGAKTGTTTGVAKGVASGVAGLVTAPLVGALGFVAKTADGIGATTNLLDIGVVEARCRPSRSVPWGRPMTDNGLPYLKAIGIRVHTVRYQKIRRRIVKKEDAEGGEVDQEVSSKEYKRIRAAEERRKNPPRKLVSVMHEKDKYHYVTTAVRPKLLTDAPGQLVLSHYAVTFEETLILRSSDLQLGDTVAINFWNNQGVKPATTRATPLGVCKISVGDIYSSLLLFCRELLHRKEASLASEGAPPAESLIVPVPQECALFRPCKKQERDEKDLLDAIGEELAAIKKSEEDNVLGFASDSSDSDSDDSAFLGGDSRKKDKEEDPASVVKANERLFGSISLSFFPIPW